MAQVKERRNFGDLGNRVKYGVLLALVALICLPREPWAYRFIGAVGFVYIGEVLYRLVRRDRETTTYDAWFYGAALIIVAAYGFDAARELRAEEYGFWTVILIACGTVGTDIGAYAGGRAFGGNHHPFPKLSPNKTTVGFVSGYVGGVIVFAIGLFKYDLSTLTNLGLIKSLVIMLLAPIVAIAGDLLESKTKRKLDIDDFSNLLGSHGGFVDRFDAMAATFFFCGFVYYWS